MVNLYMPIARTLLFPEGLSGHFIARSQCLRSAKEGRAQGAVRIGGASEPPGPQAPPLALRPRSHPSVGKDFLGPPIRGETLRPFPFPALRPRFLGPSPPPSTPLARLLTSSFCFFSPPTRTQGSRRQELFFFFHVFLHPHCLELGTENALSEGVFNE